MVAVYKQEDEERLGIILPGNLMILFCVDTIVNKVL